MLRKIPLQIVNTVIFICIVVGVTFYLQYDIYEFDDYLQSFFYTYNPMDLWKNADHAKYISYIMQKMVCHSSSLLLGIHPNENIIPRLFVAFNFALLPFLYARLTKLSANKKYTNPLVYLTAFFICFSLTLLHTDYLLRLNQHFEYVFCFILFLLFLYPVLEYFFKEEIPQRKHLLRNSLLFFINGISSYFNVYMSLWVLSYIAIYSKLKYKFSFKEFFSGEKYVGIRLPIIILLGGLGFILTNPNLQILSGKRSHFVSIEHFLRYDLFPYTSEWIHSMFTIPAVFILNVLIIGLFVFLYWKNKKISKIMTTSIIIIVAGLLFFYALIFCGKTYAFGRYYWISFSRVFLVHYYFILIPLFLLWGEASKNLKNKYCLLPFCCSLIMFISFIPYFKNNYENTKLVRQEMYKIIKSEKFYISKGAKYAVVPKKYVDWDVYTYTKYYYNWCLCIFYENYKLVYHQVPIPLHFVTDEDFIKIVQKDGLIFTKEELEKSDFNNFLR
ncbi:MAG: hypothetical protein PHV37_07730 [Candidatus Gastranaerophilales bacterium]|nr:hypothetical protein [Candidatus Gastranaerophilales bacterium]